MALIYWFLADGAQMPGYSAIAAFKDGVPGPEGCVGRLATPCAGPPEDLSFDPGRQRWTPTPCDRGRRWVGVEPAAAFAPGQLAREQQRPGHPVVLGNHVFTVPVARLALGGSGLPRRRALGPDGAAVWRVDEQFRELSDTAERCWAARAGAGPAPAVEEIERAAAAAIAINYRLGLSELLALEWLSDVALREIVEALVDWPSVRAIADAEAQKKSTRGA